MTSAFADRSPRPLLPLRQSDLDSSSSNLELMQNLEHSEILQRYTGYNKQRTKTRGQVLGILTLVFIVFGLGSIVFFLGERYNSADIRLEADGATQEHNLNRTNNIVFIPPSFIEPTPTHNKITTKRSITGGTTTKAPPTITTTTTTTTRSSNVNKTSATEINNNGPTTNPNPNPASISSTVTSINTDSQYTTTSSKPDPQISVIDNLTQSPTKGKGPKIPKDIVAVNPTSFLHIVSGQHTKHFHLEYSEKECIDGKKVIGHRAICEFRDQKFTGYSLKKKFAKTIASRKAVEHYYGVKYPDDSQWAIQEDESFSSYC